MRRSNAPIHADAQINNFHQRDANETTPINFSVPQKTENPCFGKAHSVLSLTPLHKQSDSFLWLLEGCNVLANPPPPFHFVQMSLCSNGAYLKNSSSNVLLSCLSGAVARCTKSTQWEDIQAHKRLLKHFLLFWSTWLQFSQEGLLWVGKQGLWHPPPPPTHGKFLISPPSEFAMDLAWEEEGILKFSFVGINFL